MSRQKTAWAVVNQRGDILTSTLADKRAGSIRRMVGPEAGWRTRWRHWYRRYGCRCVRVVVSLQEPQP